MTALALDPELGGVRLAVTADADLCDLCLAVARVASTWDCTQCHIKPGGTDPVFATNHVFPTDAVAEVTMAGTVRPAGTTA